MNTLRSDEYEEMASTFQCLQIDALNSVLSANGVSDPDVRMRICEEYACRIGVLFDQQWFESQGKILAASIIFIDLATCEESDPMEPGDVYLQSEGFSFEEYSFGNAAYYFEEHNETIPDLRFGGVDDLPVM